MKEDLVSFRGVKEGIFLNIHGDNLSDIKKEIDNKMENAAKFYQGVRLLGIKSDKLDAEDLQELKLVLKYKYELVISDEELPKYILELTSTANISEKEKNESDIFEGIECGMTKFVTATLRSGQVVEYDGNIVIIGDVNPGALIKAKGNIIVLGTLRGVAHAGIGGNLEAIVAAYNFQPTQLRIGDKIARAPDEYIETVSLPEIAKVKEGEVTIESYLPNK